MWYALHLVFLLIHDSVNVSKCYRPDKKKMVPKSYSYKNVYLTYQFSYQFSNLFNVKKITRGLNIAVKRKGHYLFSSPIPRIVCFR